MILVYILVAIPLAILTGIALYYAGLYIRSSKPKPYKRTKSDLLAGLIVLIYFGMIGFAIYSMFFKG